MPGSRRAKRRETTERAAPRTRARLEVDERRAQLLTLGIDLFSGRSYEDVSIDELARAAGVSKGLLYHYFPTKRAFYVAIVDKAAEQLLALTTPQPELTPLEGLQLALDAYFDYVERHAAAYAGLLRGGTGIDPEVARIVDRTREAFCERLVSAIALAASGPVVRVALRGWIGFVESASLDWIERRDVDRKTVRELVINVLLESIRLASRPHD